MFYIFGEGLFLLCMGNLQACKRPVVYVSFGRHHQVVKIKRLACDTSTMQPGRTVRLALMYS